MARQKRSRKKKNTESAEGTNATPNSADGHMDEPDRGPLSIALSDMQKRLIDDIESDRKLPHTGEAGASIEERVRAALRSVLPEKVGVSHGFVVDSRGGTSQQLDVILYDRLNCPKIRAAGGPAGAEIFPVESTYACGEVKTVLNATKLRECFDKCVSYKMLVREAYYFPNPNHPISTATPFGEPLGHNRYWESIFFVVALTGTDFTTLLKTYNSTVEKRELGARQRVDMAIALKHKVGKGNVLVSANKSKASVTPGHTLAKIDLTPEAAGQMTVMQFGDPWSVFVGLLLDDMTRVAAQPLDATRYNWYGNEEVR